MTKLDFNALYQQTEEKYSKLQKFSNQISFVRFCLGIGVIASLLYGYFQKQHVLYFLSALCLIVFLILIRYHEKIKHELKYTYSLSQVYHQHHLRMNNQWDTFEKDGHEYLKDNQKAIDLDIVGHHSLFQMINLSFSQRGQQKLVNLFIDDPQSLDDLLLHQKAVLEMSEHSDFVIEIEAYGNMIQSHKETIIQRFIDSIHERKYEKMNPLIFIVSFLTVVSLFCLCFSIGQPYAQVMLEIGLVFQLCFAFLHLNSHQKLFEPVGALNKSIQSYIKIFERLSSEQFSNPLYKNIQKRVCQDGQAVLGIKELSVIAQRIAYRQNIFAIIILNALGMYDFWLRNQYINWLDKYQDDLEVWFDGLAQIEVWMSLSVLKIDQFDVIQPQIQKEKCLTFQNLRHPLIDLTKVVGNDFTMKESVCVITGSNMSGKTTFMRTIGLNLVLAYTGGFVFANQMSCSPMHIMTSMRVKDNVEEGISTFYGELLRIKEMIDYTHLQKPMICLIDEIFKGTNSLDRIAGAQATIQKLSLPYGITFLTTHDFELCNNQGTHYLNYHFDESYEENHICFDYLIKKGPSQSTNGQFLLKQLGIIGNK